MLSSIHPFGERARQQSYTITVIAYLLGAVAGGLALGSLLALPALLIPTNTLTAALALVVLAVAAVWDLTGIGVPSLKRQVDEDWLARYRGWVYGAGYGFQLGIGFATFVKSALTYGFAGAAILSGSPVAALSAALVFGTTRGLSVLATSKVSSPSDLRTLFTNLSSSATLIRNLGGATVFAVATFGLMRVS